MGSLFTDQGKFESNIFPGMEQFSDQKIELPPDVEMGRFLYQESIAIDNPGRHEVDDAIWVELYPEGGMKVTVVIARAGLIPADSMNIPSALVKGTSTYGHNDEDYQSIFFDNEDVVELLSLDQEELKPAVAFSCDITKAGMASNQDITYVQVNPSEISPHDFGDRLKHGEFTNIKAGFNAIRECYEQDRLTYGRYKKLHKGANDCLELFANSIVSQFMIFANHQVASLMRQHDIPWIYRVCNGSPNTDNPLQMALAHYSTNPLPHDRLNIDVYGSFTSPLWQASALINHQILEYVMNDGDPDLIDIDVLKDWVAELNDEFSYEGINLELAS